jgi:hypothetical protein
MRPTLVVLNSSPTLRAAFNESRTITHFEHVGDDLDIEQPPLSMAAASESSGAESVASTGSDSGVTVENSET